MPTDPPPIDPLPEKDNGATLYVHIIAMDSGDSILVMMPESTKPNEYRYKNILIDIGMPGYVNLEKYLTHFHVTDLDGLIITHPHDDHSYNIDKFYEKHKYARIWLTEYYLKTRAIPNSYINFIEQLIKDKRIKDVFPAENAPPIKANCRGEPSSLKLIWPTTKYRDQRMRDDSMRNKENPKPRWGFTCKNFNTLDPNNSSLGITIEYMKHKIFTTGDMVELAWKEFGGKGITNPIECQGYKIAHHGAPNGTTDNTEQKVKFKYIGSNKKATFAVATENPRDKETKGLPITVKDHLKASDVGEIYSVRFDRQKVSPRPISYIIAIIPKKDGEAICNLIRYYAIDKKLVDNLKLVKAEGKDYYKTSKDTPIKRSEDILMHEDNKNKVYTTNQLIKIQKSEKVKIYYLIDFFPNCILHYYSGSLIS